MSEPAMKVLLVDPDARTRSLVAAQLSTIGCEILQAADGPTALDLIRGNDVKLVVTELYLEADGRGCLIEAIRADKKLRRTRAMAHTHRCLTSDREWAMRVGADAYLIKPTRAERMRYVVSRLATTRGPNALAPHRQGVVVDRRDSLEGALKDIENGGLQDVAAIVFGRSWWEQLPRPEQRVFRQRARRAGISLRSDALMANHFVEVRQRQHAEVALSSERPESPYRR